MILFITSVLLTSYDLFSDIQVKCSFVWPFLAFPLKCLSEKLIRISSWLKQYLRNLHRFNWWHDRTSRNWLRTNSWLRWNPRVLIQIDSWLKMLSHFSIQINSWLNRKTFDSESTHDSALSHTCLGPDRVQTTLWRGPSDHVTQSLNRDWSCHCRCRHSYGDYGQRNLAFPVRPKELPFAAKWYIELWLKTEHRHSPVPAARRVIFLSPPVVKPRPGLAL